MSRNIKPSVKRLLLLVSVALLALAAACSLAPATLTTTTSSSTPAAAPTPSVTTTVSTSTTTEPAIATTTPGWIAPVVTNGPTLSPDFSAIVAKVRPSVVAINVQLTSYNIFNQQVTQEGAGSGWIIDSSGLIVTNNHVVAGATDITVSLDDGRSLAAKLVAADAISDLAVIKIDAAGLTAATVGDSSQMKVGMMVAAIGNALGQGISMTGGGSAGRGRPSP
jgi:S1-C subfamily serine protease